LRGLSSQLFMAMVSMERQARKNVEIGDSRDVNITLRGLARGRKDQQQGSWSRFAVLLGSASVKSRLKAVIPASVEVRGSPTNPSFPQRPTSTLLPSSITASTDAKPSFTKKANFMASSASFSTVVVGSQTKSVLIGNTSRNSRYSGWRTATPEVPPCYSGGQYKSYWPFMQ
jgi:hypothetical protein